MTTNNKGYLPREGSLPHMMCTYFRANPDEELTLEDVMTRWDVPRSGIHSNLAMAIEAQLLLRTKNTDDEWVFSAGPKLGKAPVAVLNAPTPDGSGRKKAQDINPKAIDIDSIQIEDGVPLTRPGRRKLDWTPLLIKLKPGQSCRVPMAARYTLSNAITQQHKSVPAVRYAYRKINDTELRLWRTA